MQQPQADSNLCLLAAVGREWRWKMDDPLTIVCGAIDNHVKMINEYKGVPGVQAGRLQEGYQVLTPFAPSLTPPATPLR